MKLVGIPAYNEEKTIGDMIKKSLKHSDRVIVVDDGSTDNTAKIAKQSGATVISHQKNQGYGAAVITLFDRARDENADILTIIDGDGQHDPEQIPLLINALQENDVDVVIGSRFLQSSSDT
ncbi:MAG: glycosyltransferase family 2 protein, partial [Thaumarchaeota archaeon]|nr:glycosyltransferase family 2 protein [Nitrososphaerota archaeon]